MTVRRPVVNVVDDDPAMRDSLDTLLRSVGLAVKKFATAQEFLNSTLPDAAGCLVLDVQLTGLSGLDLQRELGHKGIDIPIIFITGHGDIPLAVQAMKAGAVDLLTKPFRDQDLLDAIERAIGRDRDSRQRKFEAAEINARFQSLTPREREVMQLVIDGKLNKQIAAELGTSEVTVKIQRSGVMRKMRAGSVAELVRISAKLLRPD